MGAMKVNVLALLSVSALVCRATNTTSNWTSVSHTPTTSSTHRNVGDYVALGLGLGAHDASSTVVARASVKDSVAVGSVGSNDRAHVTLTSATGDNHTQVGDDSPTSQIQTNETAILTATAPVIRASGQAHITTNITNATMTSDCWHMWLDYWSSSSLNRASYETSSVYTETRTESALMDLETQIPTSSWESFVHVYTDEILTTFSSDGFPVSVSTSYDISTMSRVGWTVVTIWSSLGVFTSVSTKTLTLHSQTTITQFPTTLPAPECELPAIVPQCNSQWSSYIHADDYPRYGDYDSSSSHFSGAPDCTQAMITGDWCTSMASFYFAPETVYGQNNDPGWVSTNSTSYFPASKTLAPGCTLGCQACSITGESVQLLYWPPATATLVEDGTGTATLTPFAQNDSSLRTVSVDGTILTSPTIYISYDILHASDSCGPVGKTYKNTILPLLNSNHLFSLETIMPLRGYGQGFKTLPFNLNDLIEPIPDSIYNRQHRCLTSQHAWGVSIYVSGRGDDDGEFSCARTGPYAPIIGVPPEVRALDPAWESCGGWYGGLFDPPKALQPADAIAKPTMPSDFIPPAASPQPTVDSGSAPVTTSAKRPQATQSQNVANPTYGSPKVPGESYDHSDAVSGVGKASASLSESKPGAKMSTHVQPDRSEGAAAIVSIFLTQGIQVSGKADDPTSVAPSSDPASHVGHGVVTSAGPGVHTALSSQRLVVIDGATLTHGRVTVNSGQTISAQPGAVSVDGVPQQHSALERPLVPSVTFTVAGKTHTAVQQADGTIDIDGESFDPGAVIDVDGSIVTVASPGILVEGILIPFEESPAQKNEGSVIIIDGQRYSVESRPGSLKINGAPVSIGGRITINGEILSIGSGAIKVEGTTIRLADGQPAENTATSDARIIISGETMAAYKDGSGVLIGDVRLTVGQVTTMSGTEVSVASDGLIVGSSTVALREMDISTEEAGDFITISGTIYTASTIAGQSAVILLAGQTLSIGGSVATIDDQVITKGLNGISLLDSTSLAPDGTSKPSSSPDTTESSSLQQRPAAPSEESYARKHSHRLGATLLSGSILISTFLNF